jgi:hypothetical protein
MALEAFYEESGEGEAVQDPAKTETVVAPTDAEPIPPVDNDTPPADEAELVPPVEEEEVSLESLVTVLGMAMEQIAEIGANLKEAERAIQTSDALDDLAHVAKSIETATPAQAAMIETIGDMAVAGTDVEPDAIVPSLEHYIGRSIALEAEGIKERAKKIWDAIVGFVARVWQHIKNFWKQCRLEYYRATLGKAGKKAESYPERVEGEVSVNRAFCELFLSPRGGFILQDFEEAFEQDARNVLGRGEAIEKALNAFDPNAPEKALEELAKRLEELSDKSDFDKRSFPGGYELQKKSFRAESGSTVEATLERLRNSTMTFGQTGKGESLSKRESVELPRKDDMRGAASALWKIFIVLDKFYSGLWTQIEMKEGQLKKASEAFVKKIGDEGMTSERRALVNFYKAYASWVYQPFIPMAGYGMKLLALGIAGLNDCSKAAEKVGSKKDDATGEKKSSADKMNDHVNRDNEARMKQAGKFSEAGKM